MANVIVRLTYIEKNILRKIAKENDTDISSYIRNLLNKEINDYCIKKSDVSYILK